ncbi:MAG TPA: alternative ribosome rescue aminoacyl-tRNA hydrolase ArfB [Gemmatimonadales bacterium]|nr:alternative ribosome rescue aminoacyl-tRNA hydrolase ArfB [Gemmatimonadales bacterium]
MSPDGWLEIDGGVRVPMRELEYRASRSGGPGGQHVNTSSTRVELVWDLAASTALDDVQRTRVLTRLASRLDATGRIRLVASGSRSQLRNREAVTERFKVLLAQALVPLRPRKRTRPSAAAKAARLEAKRRRGALKRVRRARPDDD